MTCSSNAGLYSGLGSLTLGRISGFGARFGVYEILTAFYKGITQVHVSFVVSDFDDSRLGFFVSSSSVNQLNNIS